MSSSNVGGNVRAAPVELFSTSILGNHKIRSRHERYVSVLSVKKVPYVYHDLASDEDAKSRWRRKARDPQIPGLLVHNEWRGTFEEFEEAVEFGELDLFLRIDHERAQREAKEGLAPTIAEPAPVATLSSANGNATAGPAPPSSNDRKPPKRVVNMPTPLAQPRAPSQSGLAPALPIAASGSARRRSNDADSLLRSLGLSEMSLTQEELDEILEVGSSDKPKESEQASGGKKIQDKALEGASRDTGKQPPQRTYIPSAEAGVKPLRLAKMGSPRSNSIPDASLRSPHARYNASTMSSKALAAEAQTSASSRAFSAARLRDAVSQGEDLKEAMLTTRSVSNTDSAEQVVGREDVDSLMAALGLSDSKMTEEEAEAFLFDGTIPDGMMAGGSRLGRSGDKSEQVRKEAAARNVAQRAKEKGYGGPDSPSRRSSKSSGSSDVARTAAQSPSLSPTPAPTTPSQEKDNELKKTVVETVADNKKAEKDGKDDVMIPPDPKLSEEPKIASVTPRVKLETLPEGSSDTIIEKGQLLNGARDSPKVDTGKAEVNTESQLVDENASLLQHNNATLTESTAAKSHPNAAAEKEPGNERLSGLPTRDAESTDGQYTVTILSDSRAEQSQAIPLNMSASGQDPKEVKDDLDEPSRSPSIPAAVRDSRGRPPTLLLDKSFATSMSAGQEGTNDAETDYRHEDTHSSLPKSAPAAPQARPSTDFPQTETAQHRPSTPPSPDATRQSRPPSTRTLSSSPSTGRRRAIDVQRPVNFSPSLSTSPSLSLSSPPSSHRPGSFSLTSPNQPSSAGMQRSTSQMSSSSSNETKSPSARTGRTLFGLRRRSSTKSRKGKRQDDTGAEEGEEEEISTTFEISPATRSTGPDVGDALPEITSQQKDRSQKTLSVILREADEALTGIDDEDDGENGDARSSSSEDGMDSFHLELDDDGAIQARPT